MKPVPFVEHQMNRATQFREKQALEVVQFQEAQARRLEDFQRQRDLTLENFQRSQNERRMAFNQQLNDERQNFNQSQTERRQAFRQQFKDLIAFNSGETEARQQHYARLNADLNRFLFGSVTSQISNIAKTASQAFSFAGGGYSGSGGIAMLHEDEFVLNKPTTSMLERGMGSLTQDKIQNFFQDRNFGDISPTIMIEGSTNMSESIL